MSLARVSFSKRPAPLPRINPLPPSKGGVGHPERFWIEAEIDIVRQHFPTEGADSCVLRLADLAKATGRSRRSILGVRQQANKMGLYAPRGGPHRPPRPIDPEEDRHLIDAWPTLTGRGAIARYADERGIPRWWISKRIRALGLSVAYKKEPPWTTAELQLLRTVPLHQPDNCAKLFREAGYPRTPTSIVVKAKREGLSRRYTKTISARAAARILGVDAKTVTRYCIEGSLAATRRGTQRLPQQGGDAWSITRQDLRRFILDNIGYVDIRKVDKIAFVELLAGGQEASLTTTQFSAAIADDDAGTPLFGLWDKAGEIAFCLPLAKLQRLVERETGEEWRP